MCGHSMCGHSMWALYVWPLYRSTLCVPTLWEHSMCEHSMCPLYGSTLCVSTLCVGTLCEHPVCEHHVWALYVWPLYGSTLCVGTLCESTLCVTTLCVSTLCVGTLCVGTLCEHSMCDHSMGALYVWARSSWAGCCRTPKSTRITTKTWLEFLGRMLQNTEKYENYQETSTWVLEPDVAAPKTSKKPEFYCKSTVQEHWRTPKSTRITTKNEHRRSWSAENYKNLQTKPVLDPFKSTAEHRKVRELPRKMNIEEVEEPETMKIYRQNPRASARPPRKLRKFADETNMQARNHENSDEICAQPVRHLDLATPAFYHYRKNPKCYHTVWGKRVQ